LAGKLKGLASAALVVLRYKEQLTTLAGLSSMRRELTRVEFSVAVFAYFGH
jgi:hypothetical protein